MDDSQAPASGTSGVNRLTRQQARELNSSVNDSTKQVKPLTRKRARELDSAVHQTGEGKVVEQD